MEEKRKDILIKKHKWERVGRGVGRRYRIGRESRVERRARERNRARIEITEKERAKKVHSKRKNKKARGAGREWEGVLGDKDEEVRERRRSRIRREE